MGKRSARIVVVGGSLLVHAAIVAVLASRLATVAVPTVPSVPPPLIHVDIEPRPPIAGTVEREQSATRPSSASMSVPSVTRPSTLDDEEDDRPSPSVPRVVSGTVGGSPAAASPSLNTSWQVQPEAMEDRVARSLRLGAGGCRMMDRRLSLEERRLCDDAFNEAAGRARPVGPHTLTPSQARREAEFARQGRENLANYDRRRAPLSGRIGVSGASPDCPGGNLTGGCAGAHLPDHYQHEETQDFQRRDLPNSPR